MVLNVMNEALRDVPPDCESGASFCGGCSSDSITVIALLTPWRRITYEKFTCHSVLTPLLFPFTFPYGDFKWKSIWFGPLAVTSQDNVLFVL